MLPKGRYPDSAETTVLDQQLYSRPQVYSIKPLSGHCQGAAAAVEVAAAALGYQHGVHPLHRGAVRAIGMDTPCMTGVRWLSTDTGIPRA